MKLYLSILGLILVLARMSMSSHQTQVVINNKDEFLIPKAWEVLGPFPTGMREQDFGADPLEAYGGFHSLAFSKHDRYPSELSDNGTVGWSVYNTNPDGKSVGPIQYTSIRWEFNRIAAGWSMNQFQAWARSKIRVDHEGVYLIRFSGVAEVFVNAIRLAGDYYSYKTSSHSLRLLKGDCEISIRLIYEIRLFGGGVPPKINFSFELRRVANDLRAIIVDEVGVIPHAVENVVMGEWGNVAVMNTAGLEDKPGMDNWLKVISIEFELLTTGDDNDEWKALLALETVVTPSIRIAPSQTRLITFRLPPRIAINTLFFRLHIKLQTVETTQSPSYDFSIHSHALSIHTSNWGDSMKFTFIDYDGTVQYAMAKPPLVLTPSLSLERPPIIVALHGAGVEADSPFWAGAYKRQQRAWVLQPTGRTPWGYDWHGPSYRNVETAVHALVTKMPELVQTILNSSTEWAIGEVDKLLYAGHSNGGQGAWYLTSHFPDRAIAATPAAGYLKIQDYVSYHLWLGNSFVDPQLRGILESSITEYNNDLHASNMAGLPILARTGGDDDNVPPYHTRKYVRLVNEYSHDITAARLDEVLGKGHWWDGVLDDDLMQNFLDQHMNTQLHSRNIEHEDLKKFTLTVINPAGMGSRRGILVEQLRIPYRLGKIEIFHEKNEDEDILRLETTNIRRFKILSKSRFSKFIVDGNAFPHEIYLKEGWLENLDGKGWMYSSDAAWMRSERHRAIYGPAHQILESTAPIRIVIPSSDSSLRYFRLAETIAHDWFLYGRGDAEILYDDMEIFDNTHNNGMIGNLVVLGNPEENRVAHLLLQLRECAVKFNGSTFTIQTRVFSSRQNGILFLHPYLGNHLAIIIAGTDYDGLSSAARLIPKRTGFMVPDWIVTGPEMGWKGIGGVLGAGFWDNNWCYNAAISYLA